MKLSIVLENLNSFEKNSLVKIIDNIVSKNPKNSKEISKLLSETEGPGIKNLDNVVISKIFDLINDEYLDLVKEEFLNVSSQLDIITDIIIKDGNCILKLDWFSKLYTEKLKKLNAKIKSLQKEIVNPKSDITEQKKRDYRIYKSCVDTAFHNDIENNRDPKITDDELSILLKLSSELDLSLEEVKLINYMVLPVKQIEIDEILSELKNIGVIFHSKKTNTIFVPDEIVRVLRDIREKEIADKFLRRVLRTFRDPQINLICKRHNIDRKMELDAKIKEIINDGVSFSGILSNYVHKDGTSVSDIKKFLNELWSNNLNQKGSLGGSTIGEKIGNICSYFDEIERDEKVLISIDGYDKLLSDLDGTLPKLNGHVKNAFELQEENVLQSDFLLDYNIKPRDILDIISPKDLSSFCDSRDIKTRGDKIENILETYKDSENLYLENYTNIGFRNLNLLKENGIRIKESDLGVKFEDLTKTIFKGLGFDVDEKLRKEINTSKDKMDILINLGNRELILVECKTVKESGYNKFSSVSRQMKSYVDLVKLNGYQVIKSLLISPEFTDDFINETELEYDINLSLITSSSMVKILDAFKKSKKHKKFPYKLLMRDVLIQEDRIIKAIRK